MLELREHQVKVIDDMNKGFEQGHLHQMLYAPTGFGKTEVASFVMNKFASQYQRVAMIMDRIVLVEQTSMRLNKYSIDHGVLQSGHWRYRPGHRIQICSAQTIEKRGDFPDADLIFIDEAHVSRRKINEFIRSNPDKKVIGLSATPFTKGLGDTYKHIIGSTTTSDLVDKGWLCPLRVFIAKEIDMTGAKKVAGEWAQDEVAKRGMQITGDVVSEWVKKTHEIFGQPRKTIVFCSGVAHGKDLEQQFAAAGYKFVSISYKEDDDFKRMVIEDFSRPDTDIVGLIATDILTKGFDVSDVMIGVSARPFSKSFSSHVQQLGRLMRSHEGKEFAVWLDHSGNYLRFREDWDDLYSNGVSELIEGGEKAKKEVAEKTKKESKCPKCSALWVWPDDKCGSCGHIRVRLSTVASVPGELQELAAANASLNIERQEFYSQVLYYARMKGFKEGFAAVKYKEKFGAFPRNLKQDAKPPTPQTLNWIKSRAIAYAKSQAKVLS
jgi:DNA repair protein RadD